jgi:plasmid replication initiation protein
MLKIAKNSFNKDKNSRVFKITADELLYFFNLGDKNHAYIKQELEVLNNTRVIYNFLGKDKRSKRWGSFTLIAGFEYKNGIIEYSFPHQIERMILDPKIFGKVNLVTIKGLKNKYSIALYELAEDYLNVQIPKMTIDNFRELMGLEKGQYYKFSMLRKRVIDVAIDEINSSENISFTISCEFTTKGRKITHIKFIIYKKEDVEKTGEKQKNFYRWKNLIVKKYREHPLCNNLTALKY